MDLKLRKIQHLYWRAGFGISSAELKKVSRRELPEIVERIFNSSIRNSGLNKIRYYDSGKRKYQEKANKGKTVAEKWMNKMVEDRSQLREKMTLFWHDHFATRIPKNEEHRFLHNENIRKYALGNFHDMLHGITRDAGLIEFLDADKNTKRDPNENFAREILELFTMGAGMYSEKDVLEAARAFTGYSLDAHDKFKFKDYYHDEGRKKFLGHKGQLTGDDIVKILLDKKETADFLTEKIYRFMVGGELPPLRKQQLSDHFFESGMNVLALLKQIFRSDWFYDEAVIASKVKSPLEWMAGMFRQFDGSFKSDEKFLIAQKYSGQIMFMPPTVEGWPKGKDWVTNSTFLFRLSAPKNAFYIKDLDPMKLEVKRTNFPKALRASVNVNLDQLVDRFIEVDESELVNAICQELLMPKASASVKKIIVANIPEDLKLEDRIKYIILNSISIPEYQLC